jgi:hypothetical protein
MSPRIWETEVMFIPTYHADEVTGGVVWSESRMESACNLS